MEDILEDSNWVAESVEGLFVSGWFKQIVVKGEQKGQKEVISW